MVNPYNAPANYADRMPERRAVRPYLFLVPIPIFLGCGLVALGLPLLNEEMGWYPMNYAIYEFEILGQPVSNELAITISIGAGLVSWLVALGMTVKALLNWRHNRTLNTTTL